MALLIVFLLSFIVIGGISALPIDSALNVLAIDPGPLRFTEEGTFQLSIFEDLHFGEGETDPADIYIYF